MFNLSFAREETRAPDFLAITPEGRVPNQLIDGTFLTEGTGILVYLAREYPEAHLLPEGPEAQALAVACATSSASFAPPRRLVPPSLHAQLRCPARHHQGPPPMLTLYFAPGASSMAPHIALHEIGIPFTPKPLSFARKETRTPEFLAINPEGKVPTLLIDDRPLTEVAGILFYLARKYPESRLLPEDPEAQSHAVSWMSYIASTLHPARRQGLDHATAVYRVADQKLGPNPWALGEYSIVDIHLFRLFWRFNASLGIPPETVPNLHAHHARMLARPAVQRTIEIEAAIGYELPK